MSIEIEPLSEIDGGPLLGFYAKGHHDLDAFLQAILEYAVEEGREGDLPMMMSESGQYPALKPEQVMTTWWRWVPWMGERGLYAQYEAEPHSRGAFKVTWWEAPW